MRKLIMKHIAKKQDENLINSIPNTSHILFKFISFNVNDETINFIFDDFVKHSDCSQVIRNDFPNNLTQCNPRHAGFIKTSKKSEITNKDGFPIIEELQQYGYSTSLSLGASNNPIVNANNLFLIVKDYFWVITDDKGLHLLLGGDSINAIENSGVSVCPIQIVNDSGEMIIELI